MKKFHKALILGVALAAFTLCGCDMFGAKTDAPEGASEMADLTSQFKEGGCCAAAAADGGTCEHACCVEAMKEGKVCETCNG